MGIVGPVFTVPSEFHIPNLGAPAEKFAALAAQQKIVDRNNAMLDLAVVGACSVRFWDSPSPSRDDP